MKKQLPTIFMLLFSFFVMSQQKKIDSLNLILKNHKLLDSVKLNILNSLAFHYDAVDANKGLMIADQAIDLANKLNYKEQLARAYINKANNYISIGKDSLALKLFYKSISIFESKNNLDGNASALYGIARIYQNWSDYDKSIESYYKAYNIFESKGDKISMAKMLNGVGICQMYSSNYPKAIETLIEVLRYYEEEKQTKSIAYGSVLSNIGIIYNRMESKLNLALKYHEQALNVYKKNDYKIGIANELANLANTYDNLNQPLKAIELQEQAYNIYKDIGNKTGMANALTNMGIAYTSIPDYDKTIYYLEQTLPIYKMLNNKSNLGVVHCYLGEAYLNKTGTPKIFLEAEHHLKQAIKMSKETGYVEIQSEANNLLSKLYAKNGDYKRAFQFKEAATVLNDSITSQDLKDKITRLEVKYEYDKKADLAKAENDKVQALAKAEIERQKLLKNGSILSGSLLLIMAIFGLILYKRKRDAVSQKQEAEFNATVADTELKALRTQMNPHFIFNSLNSINDYIQKNDISSASNYLTKFAKIMRQTLENSNQKVIPLEEDLKLMELYLQIESKRLKNKFTYNINVDNQLNTINTLVPPMILQPFIENSIWHGISNKDGMGHIDIDIKRDGQMIVCVVEDNGVGRKNTITNGSNQNTSLGVKITKERIDIINKNKKIKGTVTLQDKEQGLRVEVKLPLELAF